MDVSVIVPAYNSAATLGDCLAALNEQTVGRKRYDIIVIDDGSTDATAAVAAEHGARVLRQSNQGAAAARNRGVEEASGAIVAFTDADCVPARTWLAELIAPFADPEIAGTKGAYRTRQSALVARFVQIEYEERYELMSQARYIDFVDTYSAAYRRDVFLRNDGFNTAFAGASDEDQEFSFRLAERGYKMVFVPSAIVYHRHPAGVSAYARRKHKTGYWKALVLRLHPEKAVRDTHTPGSLKVQIGVVALSLPLLVLAALLGRLWLGLLAAAALLAASFARFAITAWRKDRAVGLATPALLVVRAVALGSGLLMGFVDAARNGGAVAERTPAREKTDAKRER